MNKSQHAAHERLLDASLEQMFGRQPQARKRSLPPALGTAALVLFGVGVVAAVLWSPPPQTRVLLQDVAPALPPEVFAANAAALANVPPTTENLCVRLIGPAELNSLLHLVRLRRLVVLADPVAPTPTDGTAAPAPWQAGEVAEDPGALVPLGQLPALESLQLPSAMQTQAEHLKPLRALARLRELRLSAAAGDHDFGRAVTALPALTALGLFGTEVDAGLLAALPATRLQSLALLACPIQGKDFWPGLARLQRVQRLEVTCQHDSSVRIGNVASSLSPLPEAAFDAFAVHPELRELLLDESQFDGAWLERLPVRLTLLDLGDRPLTAAEAVALQRLTALRDLTFGCGLSASSAATTLTKLSLRRLDYRGRDLDADLLRAIASHPDLTDLALRVAPSVDLTRLSGATGLTELQIRPWAYGGFGATRVGPSLEQLTALRACRALRRLMLVDCDLDVAALQAQLTDVTIRSEQRL